MSHARCSKCRGRTTLSMSPTRYIRLPKCRHCGRKMTAYPSAPTEPHYYVDRYRTRNEVGNGLKRSGRLCRPGQGGCNEYHFPHRRGSGWCVHNKNIPDSEREQRWLAGAYDRKQWR